MINVLLVDDHELVRAGIRRILEDIKGIKVVGEASCGEDAVKWCRTNAVDVVLMDMSMPGIGGLEATRKIARSTADVKIIMLTVHTENPLPAKVMQAGAAGYLSKGAAPQEVVSAIRSVYSGQRYIASDIAQQMALSQIEPEKTESPFASLSERELQIMLMITKGQKVNEIDPELVGEVLNTIRQLAQEKRTMVIVTHEMSFARDVADRAIFMDQGRIVEQGAAKALFADPEQPRTRQFLEKFLLQ